MAITHLPPQLQEGFQRWLIIKTLSEGTQRPRGYYFFVLKKLTFPSSPIFHKDVWEIMRKDFNNMLQVHENIPMLLEQNLAASAWTREIQNDCSVT